MKLFTKYLFFNHFTLHFINISGSDSVFCIKFNFVWYFVGSFIL